MSRVVWCVVAMALGACGRDPAKLVDGAAVFELGEMTVYTFDVKRKELPSLRFHTDGRIEGFDGQWTIKPVAVDRTGQVLCEGTVVGRIGGADGLPHPADRELAAEWSELSWKIETIDGAPTMKDVDGGTMTLDADGALWYFGIDEDGQPQPKTRWGRLEGASSPGEIHTAMWMLGLLHGDEQPMCDP